MFDWSDLRYLLAVAREGSTLAAARSLRVNQSTVQRRLIVLERQLGLALVERHPTGYRLSDQGIRLLPQIEAVEMAVGDIQRHVATLGQDTNGSIKLTCSTALAQRLMRSRLLDSFRAQYPAVEVELIMTERVLDLAKGEADIAIRGGKPTDSQLIGKKITDVPWAIYASRSYVRKIGALKRANDFSGHDIIELSGEIANLPAARWLRTKTMHCRVSGRASNLASVHVAARSGVGLAPLPVPWAEFDGDLVQISKPLPEMSYPMYLVTHPDLMGIPRIAAFFAHCLEDLGSLLRDGALSKGKKRLSSRSRPRS